MENNIFNRLYEQEATPPPGMWNRIVQKLDEEEVAATTPVVMLQPKAKFNWLKIAIAASFLGFAIMTTLWIAEKNAKKQPSTNEVVKTNTVIQKDTVFINTPTPTMVLPNDVIVNAPIPNNTVTNNTNSTVVKNTPQANDVAVKNPRTINTTVTPKTTLVSTVKTNDVVSNPQIAPVIIKDENGNPIRNIEVVKTNDASIVAGPISKGDKAIGNIISKISLSSDKEEIDSIINSSAYWKKQIQEWRVKLIKSGYTPTLINHLDIIELKKLIDEKK